MVTVQSELTAWPLLHCCGCTTAHLLGALHCIISCTVRVARNSRGKKGRKERKLEVREERRGEDWAHVRAKKVS